MLMPVTYFTASIISNKAAAGVKYLVLDLKVGTAGIFNSVDQAKEFGEHFVSDFLFVLSNNNIKKQ